MPSGNLVLGAEAMDACTSRMCWPVKKTAVQSPLVTLAMHVWQRPAIATFAHQSSR